MAELSSRVKRTPASATVSIADAASEMRRRGIEVLDFSAGRAAESSPGTINRAAADSLLGGDTHQTQARGRPEYLQNIVHRLKKDNGLDLDPAKKIIATINCMGDMVGTIVVAHSEGWKPVSSKG